jgi:hypothetical protein
MPDARRRVPRGPLRTRSGAFGRPRGSPRRPSRPLSMPSRALAIRRRPLVAPRGDFAALRCRRRGPRGRLVKEGGPPRAPRHPLAASRGHLPTSRRPLLRSSGTLCTSRRPLVTPLRPVPPPRRPSGARRASLRLHRAFGPGQDIADTLLRVGCRAMAAIGCLSFFKKLLFVRTSSSYGESGDGGIGCGYDQNVNVEPYRLNPPPPDPYATAWVSLRRKRWLAAIGMGCFIGGGISISRIAKGPGPWTALPLMLIVAASQVPVAFFRCPHCDKLFSGGTWFSRSWDTQIRMYFASRCKQCGAGPTKVAP